MAFGVTGSVEGALCTIGIGRARQAERRERESVCVWGAYVFVWILLLSLLQCFVSTIYHVYYLVLYFYNYKFSFEFDRSLETFIYHLFVKCIKVHSIIINKKWYKNYVSSVLWQEIVQNVIFIIPFKINKSKWRFNAFRLNDMLNLTWRKTIKCKLFINIF